MDQGGPETKDDIYIYIYIVSGWPTNAHSILLSAIRDL